MISTGTHYPNFPGARTSKEARRLTMGCDQVTVVVGRDTARMFAGTRLVATRPRSIFAGNRELMQWAQGTAGQVPARLTWGRSTEYTRDR